MPEPVQVALPTISSAIAPPAHNIHVLQAVAQRLQDGIRTLIDYEPGSRPLQVARRLGLSKDISSRVVTCCEFTDPLEFAYNCPSPATLRKLIDAAREVQPGATVERADRLITEFENLVQSEFSDQSTMKVLIGSMHPALGEKSEALQKQSAFRGMSQLHGLFAEVYFNAAVCTRGDREGTFDMTCSEGCLGLRRLRPGPPIVLKSGKVDPKTGERETLEGEVELSSDWKSTLGLDDVHGASWVAPSSVPVGNTIQTRIDRDILGTRRSINFGVSTRLAPTTIGTVREKGNPWTGIGLAVPVPSKLLVWDVLLEEGLFENARPKLVMYDTAIRGTSPLFDPLREFDRLHLHERVEELDDRAGHHSPDVPFLPRVIDYMQRSCNVLDRVYRRYRVRQTYPVYGSQVAMALPRPPG